MMIRERLRECSFARLLATMAMALSIVGLPGLCRAAEPLTAARPADLPAVLASVTVLSETAMSKENAAGVQPVQIIGGETGHARVTLWDELKTSPQLPAAANGTVSPSTGGK
jgi:hypothetical protein